MKLVPLAYAPRRAPLGTARPWVVAAYLAPAAIAAFATANPILILAAGLVALIAGWCSGAGESLRGPLRWSLILGVMVVLVNGIVSQRGETILLRGWDLPMLGQIDISLEALAEGGVLALRIIVAILVFAVWSACVDPDRILRAIRPFAGRSALTATLVSRLVPLAATDAARLSEAGGLRGPAAAPLGRAALARRLVAGSLDRSVDVAATLELRGYSLGHRHRLPRHTYEPGEAALLAAGLAMAATLIAAFSLGLADFDAYPTIEMSAGIGTFAVAALLPLFAWLPFAGTRLARLAHPLRPAPRGAVRVGGVDA